MKQYTQPFLPVSEVAVPVLHRVYYSADKGENVRDWLLSNCQEPFYTSPGWVLKSFIEFEDDQDAFKFALRWA